MKKHISAFLALGILVFLATACNFSFTTASISSLNFGKNETATPPTTTFDVGDKIYAVANISGNVGKGKIKFKIILVNVPGRKPGEEAGISDIPLQGNNSLIYFFTPPLPGEYKIEATMVDEDGKEIDKKSGTVTVKGGPPQSTTSTEPKKDDDHDSDSHSEDKPKDK